MKVYFGRLVYHWRLWGLVGRNARWFVGVSVAPVVDETINDNEPIQYTVTPTGRAMLKDGE